MPLRPLHGLKDNMIPSLLLYDKSVYDEALPLEHKKYGRQFFLRKPRKTGPTNGRPQTAEEVTGLEAQKPR